MQSEIKRGLYKDILSIGSNMIDGSTVISSSISDSINSIKLSRTFDAVVLSCNYSYELIIEYFTTLLRLCREDTVIFFTDVGNLHFENFLRIIRYKIKNINFYSEYVSCQVIKIGEKILPTIVTAIFDVRKLEGNSNGVRKIDDYIKLGKKLLELEIPVVVFTSPDLYNDIISLRPIDLIDTIKIISIEFKDMSYYSYLDDLNKCYQEFKIHNLSAIKDTPLYITLTNNKLNFLSRVMDSNPFGSKHFIWLDFGISHIIKDINVIRRWIKFVPDKIRQLELNPYLEDIKPKEYFCKIYHNVAGGLISGSMDNLKIYDSLFRKKWEEILKDGWYQLDEGIMAMVIKENQSLFDNYYGEYDAIIDGYDAFLYEGKSHALILQGIKKALDVRNHSKAWAMINYIRNYSIYNPGKCDMYLYNYIICKYYVSDVKTIDIDEILAFKGKTELIKLIAVNLKFYINHDLI